jgi:hypothetical protein
VTVSPATGKVRANAVDEDSLRSVVDRVQRAFPILAGHSKDATPGPHCRWCKLQPDCPPGKNWMDQHSLMGRLPVATLDSELTSD